MKIRKGIIPSALIITLAGALIVGGVGLGLAWKTDYLDRWLSFDVKKFLGKVERETRDWKIYKNKRFGYSVKYPPNWFAYSDLGGELVWITSFDANLHVGEREVGWEEVPIGEVAILIDFVGDDKPFNQSLADYSNLGGTEYQSVKFGGRSWIERSHPVYTVASTSIEVLYVSNGSNVYGFSFRGSLNDVGEPIVISAKNLRLVEYLASTIEFFERSGLEFDEESAPEGSIPGWKVYTNPPLGFSAEYPPSWVVTEKGGYVEFQTPDFSEGTEVAEIPPVGKRIEVSWEWNGRGDGGPRTPRERLTGWDPYPYKVREDIVVDQYPGVLYEVDFSSVEGSRGVRVGSYVSVGIRMYKFDCFAWDIAEKEQCAEVLEQMLSTTSFTELEIK